MNRLILAALILSFSIFAAAEEEGLVDHQSICERSDAIEARGESGSCRLLVVPQKVPDMVGSCVGQFKTLTCKIDYGVISVGTALSMNCGTTEAEFFGDASIYQLGALVKNAEGKQTFIRDEKQFVTLRGEFLTLKFEKVGEELTSPKIELDFGFGSVQLTDVLCI